MLISQCYSIKKIAHIGRIVLRPANGLLSSCFTQTHLCDQPQSSIVCFFCYMNKCWFVEAPKDSSANIDVIAIKVLKNKLTS